MRRLVSIVSILGFLAVSCSDDKKAEEENEPAATSQTDTSDAELGEEENSDGGDDPLFELGLPDFCKRSDKSDETCFECTPRELPLTQCFEKKAAFDEGKDCNHDLDQLTCDLINFKWDFNDRDKIEAMYERLPFIATIIKALVASKFKDKPETVEHIGMMVDLLIKHRKNIFTNQNIDEVAKDGVAVIKEIRPDLTIDEAQAAQSFRNILGVLEAKRATGELKEADVLAMLAGMFGQLPVEVGDLIDQLQNSDLNDLAGSTVSDILGGGEPQGDPDPTDPEENDDSTEQGATQI